MVAAKVYDQDGWGPDSFGLPNVPACVHVLDGGHSYRCAVPTTLCSAFHLAADQLPYHVMMCLVRTLSMVHLLKAVRIFVLLIPNFLSRIRWKRWHWAFLTMWSLWPFTVRSSVMLTPSNLKLLTRSTLEPLMMVGSN